MVVVLFYRSFTVAVCCHRQWTWICISHHSLILFTVHTDCLVMSAATSISESTIFPRNTSMSFVTCDMSSQFLWKQRVTWPQKFAVSVRKTALSAECCPRRNSGRCGTSCDRAWWRHWVIRIAFDQSLDELVVSRNHLKRRSGTVYRQNRSRRISFCPPLHQFLTFLSRKC